MTQLTLDLYAARKARDDGMARSKAKNADWLESALSCLEYFCEANEYLTLEAFRQWWLSHARKEPTSHHAWGSLGMTLTRTGWVEYVKHVPAQSEKTHAHKIPMYRSLIYKRAA